MRLSKLSDKVRKSKRAYKPSALLSMPTNLVGVEIEIEGIRTNNPAFAAGTPINNFWEAVEDPSLRRGTELRFKNPLFGSDIIGALKILDSTLKPLKYTTSIRTSTHVHYDVSIFNTTEDLLKLLVLAGMFEKVLFNYVGGDRADSIYCIPYSRGRGDFLALSSLNKDSMRIDGRTGRYQAINLQSLFAHGTVEFRHAKAYTTYDELLSWINILGSIVKYASEEDFAAKDLAGMCSAKSPIELLFEVFPDYHRELMYDGIEEDIMEGARMVDDMIHMIDLQGLNVYRGLDSSDGGIFAEVFSKQLGKKPSKKQKKGVKRGELRFDVDAMRGFRAPPVAPPEPVLRVEEDVEEDDEEW